MDADLMRSDDRQAMLNEMERYAMALQRYSEGWQTQVRAIAIWRLRQQLVKRPRRSHCED
jgi:hypothetical protein